MDYAEEFLSRFSGGLPTPGRIDWASVEKNLGGPVPSDYKKIMSRMPRFALDMYIGINGPDEIADFSNKCRRDYRQVYPERSGLFLGESIRVAPNPPPDEFVRFEEMIAFGSTDTGCRMYWWARGENPDHWPVLVAPKGFLRKVECGFAEFLVRLVDADVQCPEIINEDWPEDEVEVEAM